MELRLIDDGSGDLQQVGPLQVSNAGAPLHSSDHYFWRDVDVAVFHPRFTMLDHIQTAPAVAEQTKRGIRKEHGASPNWIEFIRAAL